MCCTGYSFSSSASKIRPAALLGEKSKLLLEWYKKNGRIGSLKFLPRLGPLEISTTKQKPSEPTLSELWKTKFYSYQENAESWKRHVKSHRKSLWRFPPSRALPESVTVLELGISAPSADPGLWFQKEETRSYLYIVYVCSRLPEGPKQGAHLCCV